MSLNIYMTRTRRTGYDVTRAIIIYETGCAVQITRGSRGKRPARAIKIGTDGTVFNLYGFSRELLLRRRRGGCAAISLNTCGAHGKGIFNIIIIYNKTGKFNGFSDVFNFL